MPFRSRHRPEPARSAPLPQQPVMGAPAVSGPRAELAPRRHAHAGERPASSPVDIDLEALTPIDRPRGLRCYLVEDSPVIRQNLIATLEELLSVEIVGTAEDEYTAVGWLQQRNTACDLVIIDLFLKAGTGLEVLRQARDLRPSARLVVLTNYATPDIRQRCQGLGADQVFDKSMELDELIAYCEQLPPSRTH